MFLKTTEITLKLVDTHGNDEESDKPAFLMVQSCQITRKTHFPLPRSTIPDLKVANLLFASIQDIDHRQSFCG